MEAIQEQAFKQSFEQHSQRLATDQVQALRTIFQQLVTLFIVGYRKKFVSTIAVPAATFLIAGLILTSYQFSLLSTGLIIFIVYGSVYVEMTKPFRRQIKQLRKEINHVLNHNNLARVESLYLFEKIPELKKFL